jgi:hypothetical protein
MNTRQKIKLPECLCGCGGRTKGGRFLPGHDAKLKKVLVADAHAGAMGQLQLLQRQLITEWVKTLRKGRLLVHQQVTQIDGPLLGLPSGETQSQHPLTRLSQKQSRCP